MTAGNKNELAKKLLVSSSHLGRIERGSSFHQYELCARSPSPWVLVRVELFTYAGYLSPQSSTAESEASVGRLDPYVSSVLASEPVEVQRTLIGILTILKALLRRRSEYPIRCTWCDEEIPRVRW